MANEECFQGEAGDKLVRYAYTAVRKLAEHGGVDQDDYAQAILLSAWRRRDDWKPGGTATFASWAMCHARNLGLQEMSRFIGQGAAKTGSSKDNQGKRRAIYDNLLWLDQFPADALGQGEGDEGGMGIQLTDEDDLTDIDIDIRIDHASLTPRQAEIIALLRAGLTMAEVARHLGVIHQTIQQHAKTAAEKMGLCRLSETFSD